jgi:hypothetical protein
VNLATGNLHLQSNSPCIGAGFNVANLPSVDADGRPRVVDTTVDVGAYEYQGAAMEGYISWLASAGLPTHVTSDTADLDQDGASSWEEWRADTVPTNGASVLRMAAPTAGPVGLDITWQSVATRNYWLERAEYLEGAPAFQTIATNLHGVAGTVSYSDTQATNGWPYFYRVGVY